MNLIKYSGFFKFCVLFIVGSLFINTFCYASEKQEVRLLALSGSARKDSCNNKALKLLAKAATDAGAKVTFMDLSDYSLPMYNGDFEAEHGLPEDVKKLQKLIAEHDGFIIASPEYNGLPTPLLKNTLDWASRPDKNNPNTSGLKIFENKVAALISASPSSFGGIRGLPIMSEFLSNLGLIVIPEKVMIANCYENFDKNGNIKDDTTKLLIIKEGKTLSRLARALKSTD